MWRTSFSMAAGLLLLCSVCVWAQSTGSISGVVNDATGAVIPGAAVIATNTQTGVVVKVTSLEDGKFLLGSLLPGTYVTSVEMPGFKRYSGSAIEVHVGDRLTLNIALEIGTTVEEVNVTADAPLLRTEDAQVGEVINNNFISNLPQLNRDAFGLLRLAGNVQGTGTSVQLNGGRTSAVDYYVDGGVVNSGQANRLTNQVPSMDAVSEFKVVTAGISAEYGRISGGYVTLVTKGGTNKYHGSVYEYMFNDMFNANAWDQNAIGAKKAHFRQNNFGFTLGGPVDIPGVYDGHNKTFFFVDNEYLRKNQAGAITLSSVPTALERTGDFTQTARLRLGQPAAD
jgi:hypothetical protein